MPGYKPAPKKRKPKPKVSTQTPIFGSIEDGDAEEFAECLSQTPECLKEVNKNGWTPLHQAAFSGQLAMLNTLLPWYNPRMLAEPRNYRTFMEAIEARVV